MTGIDKSYHVFTLPGQVQRGSIKVRKDPKDLAEWQFALEEEIKYKTTEEAHEKQACASGKAEAVAFMKVKAAGLMGMDDPSGLAEQALADVGAGNKKSVLAIKDKDASTHDEVETEAEPSPKKKKAADPDAEEAELLSDIGASSNKDLAKKRVLKMVALLEKVKKDSKVDSSTPKGKKLLDCLQELKKLQKTGTKLNMETAKQQLFEGALAIKRIKK